MSRQSDITNTLQKVPPALAGHAVTLLLSYLSPLESPLPPHLLSEPLQQRHHFLGLGQSFENAEDAAAYISWPSSDSGDNETARIITLLGDLPSPDNFDPLVAYPTKYSYDGETIYAHSHVSVNALVEGEASGLRLVFRWEGGQGEGFVRGRDGHATNADGWKFHDAKSMPFPLGTYDSPEGVLDSARRPVVSAPSVVPRESRANLTTKLNGSFEEAAQSDNDDDYWNSYGQSNDEGDSHKFTRTSNSSSNLNTEDAYWARYASVHGTADSTVPSPPVPRRRLHDSSQPLPAPPSNDDSMFKAGHDREDREMYDPDMDRMDRLRFLMNSERTFSPDVPSPDALARRLYTLSPRADSSASSLLETSAPTIPTETDSNGFDSSTSSHSEGQLFSPEHEQMHTNGDSGSPTTTNTAQPKSVTDKDGVDRGLRDSVKGLFCLWTHSHNSESSTMDAEYSKQEFLRIVHDSLHGLQ